MNGFSIFTVGLILLLILILGYLKRNKTWITVYEGVELTEQASDEFALLQRHDLRCRIRNVPLPHSRNTGPMDHGSTSSTYGIKTIVEIHKADVEKARQLLEQHISGQFEFRL
jgi:hypothetical protein